MKPSIHQNFTIHPIGQGLFYSGKIELNNIPVFKMIFDCGSNSKGAKDEALLYRKTNFSGSDKVLDLLVISHFDADHVNHIKTVVENDVKIKKVVMPFISFEERLFLALKHMIQSNKDIDNINFILNPLKALGDNLDEDSEVYIITSNEEPIIKDENQRKDDIDKNSEERLIFEFSNPEKLTEEDLSKLKLNYPENKLQKTSDTNIGNLLNSVNTKVMEFLFYRKDIGASEAIFFEKVKDVFFKEHELDTQESPDAIHEKIKNITSSKSIKEIFKKAYKALIPSNKTNFPKEIISNLNHTALCMLHRNLKALYELNGSQVDDHQFYIDPYGKLIQKTDSLIQEIDFHHRYFHHRYFHKNSNERIFPNVLLTSDTYLKEESDVTALFKKYENYKNTFWMFQVPHHGSKNNSDKNLFGQISYNKFNFINYGINNRNKHPNNEVLLDLVATGHYKNLIPVNEFQGLSFGFYL